MVSEMTDKLITPGRYETADEYHEKRLSKVSSYNNYNVTVNCSHNL